MSPRPWPARLLPLAALLVLLSACGGSPRNVPVDRTAVDRAIQASIPGTPLYDRLGRLDGIRAVVDDATEVIAQDPRINSFFATTDMERLRLSLVEQICSVSGGPCVYTGRTMQQVHAGLGITEAHWEAFLEDVTTAMSRNDVGRREQRQLLFLLRQMKADVVAPTPA